MKERKRLGYKTLLSATLFLLSHVHLFAQNNIEIKGSVTDAKTHEPIPFAYIFNNELSYYAQTENDGNFKLYVAASLKSITLHAGCIGYFSDSVIITNPVSQEYPAIELKQNPTDLPVATVDELTPKSIVRKAIQNIHENYIDSSFSLNASYCQYHFERNIDEKEARAVRLIFADVDFMEKANKNNSFLLANESVHVNNVLRSEVYEQSKEEHGDHLVDLLEENPVYHSTGTVLNGKALNYYYFSVESNEQNIYKIKFESRNNNAEKIDKGYLLIDRNTFAIVSLYKEEFPNSAVMKRRNNVKSIPYRWDFEYGQLLVNFQSSKGKYFLKNSYRKYRHMLTDNKTLSPAYEVTECFEIEVNGFNENYDPENYDSFSHLYTLKQHFSESFYQMMLNHNFFFIDGESKRSFFNDLEHAVPLSEQVRKTR